MATRLTPEQVLNRSISETELQQEFVAAAMLLGWKVMHVSDSRRMVNHKGRYVLVGDSACKGWPDLFLAHPATGRLLAVEVKVEDPNRGKVTDDQQEWLDALSQCGVETFVLRPSLWSEGAALLKRRGRRAA